MESVAGNRGKNEGEKGLAAKKEKNFILDGFSRAGPVTPVLPADPSLSLSLSSSAIPRLISGITNRFLVSIPSSVVMNT